ncbi:uracil-DNA glycosylase family protein [Pikeienuella piscinae]|uniref:Uracil-DNA glycosylase family protein n=1 Tax=Pikeienuella piscinae TaxID=2748098 RepID=A0A7L5BZA0_9RHOB|nr:uracil-DNA glycosylase family protein [Pikeienuella piscinae]QIE57062.1 uracil-DNA glycosylase family protein [Pikeienuella piscinae]
MAHEAGDIEMLEVEIASCRACAAEFAATRTRHEPRPVTRLSSTARILIAGQAPGIRVHESGVPFDDRSGDRLRDWMGIDRAAFYDRARIAILPMAFCFPGYDAKGSDLPPPRRCAELWRERALGALRSVELTLLVGGYAQKWTLKDRRPLSALVSDWRAYAPSIMPLPHPSWRNTGWLKKNPWFEAEAVPVLRARVAALL